jgi:hypothetical protein
MSGPRNMLRALTELTGQTPEHVEERADIPIKRIYESLQHDWPMPKKHRPALAAFTKTMLRTAYALGTRRMMQIDGLREDPASHKYLRDLEDAYVRCFGVALLDDVEVPQ